MKYQRVLFLRTAMFCGGAASVLGLVPSACAADAGAAGLMPAAEQNAVLQKHCGSCHSDALMYGGLSVQHFDAAHPDPTVAAMLVSKLTSGHTPLDVQAAAQGPDADVTVRNLARGAMGADGKPVPDDATQVAFVKTFAAQAAGAEEWHSNWTDASAAQPALTANVLRQAPSLNFEGITDTYRLVLTCRTQTHAGEIKVTWANGTPMEGQPFAISVDGKPAFKQKAEGGRRQGNGDYGPGSAILYPNGAGSMRLPEKALMVSDVFPGETVVFPFEGLSPQVRRSLAACFGSGESAH